MSSYDHPQSYGRAGGAGHDGYDEYGYYEDTYAVDSYGADPYPADSYSRETYSQDSYGRSGADAPAAAGHGRAVRAAAVVGAASAGRASVPPASPAGARPRYDWTGGGGDRPAAGRASVPVSPGTGPAGAATGRASVRPGGPAGGGPGRPAAGAGGRGKPPGRRKNRHWLRNSLLSALAVLVIMTGGGMVALSYYVESVPPPQDMDLEEASTILFEDGSEMALMQEVNREIIDTKVDELKHVRDAVVAAEDKEFFEHSGVDFMGIMRAAVNNLRGGARQGASTIDQQYAGAAAEIRDDASYSRKLKEAAMAYKMNQDHSKLEILDFYLNTIYFGRGAYGVEAAAQAYFGKRAEELTPSEAAVLAGVIRLPDDGSTLSPYDPRHNPDDPSIAIERWDYVLTQMMEIGAVTAEERAEWTELPETIEPRAADEPFKGPQGNIVRQVRRELEAMGIEDLYTGGYRITTTIDPDIQKAALEAARRGNKGPLWDGMPKNIDAALVAINPADGSVLAYYGGDDGTGFDLAGKNWNEERQRWEGGRAPGSSFKIYSVIAALREGVSLKTHWKTSEYEPDWMDEVVRNADRDARTTGCEGQAPDYCTLRWSIEQSYNVPFAHFSEAVPGGRGPELITQAAMDAGIRMMRDTREGEYHDLTAIESAAEVAPEHFFHPVAYGQYPVTVLDHASGVATLAADGVYHEPHFVKSVEQKIDGEWVQIAGDQISGEQRIEPAHAQALTGALTTVPGVTVAPTGVPATLADGRQAAAKTGTWEHPDGGNLDAWMVGYTPQIASAVWVGDEEGKPIKDQNGNNIGSSGLPSQIWKQFMDAAHAAKEYEAVAFPPPPEPGDPQHEYANGVQPEPERPGRGRGDDDPRCRLPLVNCDDDDEGGPGDPGDPGDGEDDGSPGDGGGDEIQPPPGGGGEQDGP